MEIDTGTTFTIISKRTYDTIWSKETTPRLRSANIPLKTYTKEPIDVLGSTTMSVSHNGQTREQSLLVVAGEGRSLLGRD